MRYRITLQHIFYNQWRNDALNAAGQTTQDAHIYPVGSITVNFKEMGQQVAAAVGCPTTV